MEWITDDEQKRILAENLQAYIRMSGKEQKQIALDLGEKPSTFNQWVKGKAIPKATTLQNIARYFNVSLADIVNEKHDKNIRPFNYELFWSNKLKKYANQNSLNVLDAYYALGDGERRAVDKILGIPCRGELEGESSDSRQIV